MADGQGSPPPGYGEVDVKSVLTTIAQDVLTMASRTPPPPCTTTSSRIVSESVAYALFNALYGGRPEEFAYPPIPLGGKR